METILIPSPNWFHVQILGVSIDGWLVYGGPNKSLCVLEPLQKDEKLTIADGQSYKAHVILKAHPEKIVCVDLAPEWPKRKCFIAGSIDGIVKHWTVEGSGKDLKIKAIQSHDYHFREKEEVAGVAYTLGEFAITVGSFGNIVKWDLHSNVLKINNYFLKNFKPVCISCCPHLPLVVAVGTKQGVIFVVDFSGPGKILYKVRGQDEEIVNLSWCPIAKVTVKKTFRESPGEDTLSFTSAFDETENMSNDSSSTEPIFSTNILDASGVVKYLPDDSFDDGSVLEEDLFDKYKDHEDNEFGHKKYQPEDIVVKIKDKAPEGDYLSECMKLKEDILQKKKTEEQDIESLVEAMDKTCVDDEKDPCTSQSEVTQVRKTQCAWKTTNTICKNMLASVGKFGGVRIWSKNGKLVATCTVPVISNKSHKSKATNWPSLLWYKPDILLIADGKSELLEINPLLIDYKNKLEWRQVHALHKRGLYCIVSQAPRIQAPTEDHWPVWTVSQDRNLIKYCMKTRQMLATYASSGGYIYKIQSCPYDAGKIAISVGDGAVRVWQTMAFADDDTKLTTGKITTYWQNVQGKVLKIAWHPSKENMLAFSTAEARVGIIEASGKQEKPARALLPALRGGVYSLCWGHGYQLYACGGGELVVYQADRKDQFPSHVNVVLEGQKWELTEANWHPYGLAVGSGNGAVAVLTPTMPHAVLAVAFIFSKMIYTIEWHPQQISTSNEESPFKNLIAVCSLEKQGNIAILEFGENEDKTKRLNLLKMLSGHKSTVHDIAWNPHRDAQLLSSSADGTYKVWDVCAGAATHVLAGLAAAALCAAWSAFPALPGAVLTGGSDYSLRLWDTSDHPAHAFHESKYHPLLLKKDKKKTKDKREIRKKEEYLQEPEEQIAATLDTKVKSSRRYLLPTICKQMNNGKIDGARRLFDKYKAKQNRQTYAEPSDTIDYDLEYLKIFGSIKEVNEVLDNEMERHMETGNFEAWIILCIFRGHIEDMVQFASQRDMLCPYLLSLTPCVSYKYWKDATQLYLTQIDRLVARGEEEKLSENRTYGGPVYRKVATLLSVHDVRAAVIVLTDARLYREAYVLCRIRFMDSIAEDTLKGWAAAVEYAGNTVQAAVCYLVLGNLHQATLALSKANKQECLSLAADLAKVTGQSLFANHIEKKVEMFPTCSNSGTDDTSEDTLQNLPTRTELFLAGTNEGESESVTNEESVSLEE